MATATVHAITIYLPPDAERLPDNDQWENRFEIRSSSSNRKYIIAQHKALRHWGCSCPGWRTHRNCTHLKNLALPCHQQPFEAILS
jgi:hypothetical protein